MNKIVILNERDNVATSLVELERDAEVRLELDGEMQTIKLLEPIPFGHKFAIRPLTAGEAVCKYGETIGQASVPISTGQWVHTHNIESTRARGDLA